jgi:DNA-directed RNA polymerase subunit RPC12/RpoP
MRSVKLRRPEPGEKDPMIKGFEFAITDPETGLTWVYICVETKSRGRRKLVRLGIEDEVAVRQADQAYVCADCGAVVLAAEELLPMSDLERQEAPSLPGHCPKCGEGFCIMVKKDEMDKGTNAIESPHEVSNERQQ